MNRNKFYILTAVAVAAAFLVITTLNRNGDKINSDDLDINNSDGQENLVDVNIQNQENALSENLLEGILRKSDDLNLGNLKLTFGEKEIYIKTGRDFSRLIGKEVIVLINGDEENFELVDIHSKQNEE